MTTSPCCFYRLVFFICFLLLLGKTYEGPADSSSVYGGNNPVFTVAGYTNDTIDRLAKKMDIPASVASLTYPTAFHFDGQGNIYIADKTAIWLYNASTTTMSIFIGGGDDSGDGVAATDVVITDTRGITGDSNGNIYYSDFEKCVVRKYDVTQGTVSTVVGVYESCHDSAQSGDFLFSDVQLNRPWGIFYSELTESLFIAVSASNYVLEVDFNFNKARCVLGQWSVTGNSPGNLPPLSTNMDTPIAVFVRAEEEDSNNTLYCVDSGNNLVRKVALTNDAKAAIVIGTAGSSGSSGSDGQAPADTSINKPICAAVNSVGDLFVVESPGIIRRALASDSTVYTISNTAAYIIVSQMTISTVNFAKILGCGLDSDGNLVVSSLVGSIIIIWKIVTPSLDGSQVEALVGYVGGVTIPAQWLPLSAGGNIAMWSDTQNNLYVVDGVSNGVHKIDMTTNTSSYYAGGLIAGYDGGGLAATLSRMNAPNQIVGDTLGNLYIYDSKNAMIRTVKTDGVLRDLVGGEGSVDGVHAMAYDSSRHCLYLGQNGFAQKVDITTVGLEWFSSSVLSNIVSSFWVDSFFNVYATDDQTTTSVHYLNISSNTMKDIPYYYSPFTNNPSCCPIMKLCGDYLNNLYIMYDNFSSIMMIDFQSKHTSIVFGSRDQQLATVIPGEFVRPTAAIKLPVACYSDTRTNTFYFAEVIGQNARIRAQLRSFPVTVSPSIPPTRTPTSQPSVQSSAQPSSQPTGHPSGQPTLQPSASPSQPNLASSRLLTTVAGYNTLSGPTDNNAITATLTNIRGVCVNDLGHIYIADDVVVKKIFPESNSIILYAGGGSNMGAAVSPASDKKFGRIGGLAVDEQDRVYLTDSTNSRVHVIDPTTMLVYTIAGAGSVGYSGDWSFANQSLLNRPSGLFCHRPSHILYVADTGNRVVRSVDLSARFNDVSAMGTSIINTVVSSYGEVRSIWVSAAGVIFLTDSSKCSVYKYDKATELLDRVVGNGMCSSSVIPANSAVPATSISLQTIVSITGSDVEGTLYVSPNDANGLRRVNLSSLSMERVTASSDSLVVGHDLPAIIEKVSASYCFYCNNTMIIADTVQKYIWRYRPDTRNMEVITGFVGGLSVPANSVNLAAITGMAANTANGDLYFVDAGKNKVYLIKKQHSGTMISIMAGTGFAGYNGDDQPASLAALNNPMSIVIDARQGDLYISEFLNNRVRKIDGNTMIISTVMGTGISTCDSSLVTYRGPATSLNLCSPSGLAMDSRKGVLYYSDSSYVIRKLWLNNGTIETIAGNGHSGYLNGGLLASKIGNIYTMVLSRDGSSIYIFDVDYHCVRLVDLVQDRITTVVGQCNTPGYSEDGVRASVAFLNGPRAGSLDAEENLYIFTVNAGVHYVLRSYSERLYHFVGNSSVLGFSGDDQPPLSSLTSSSLASLFMDEDVYFSEFYVQGGGITIGRVRKTYSVEPTSLPTAQPQSLSSQPTSSPSTNPSLQPSTHLSGQPSGQPSSQSSIVTPPTVPFTKYIKPLAGLSKDSNLGHLGDGGPLREAFFLESPGSIYVDTLGNLYIMGVHHLRIVNATTKLISTLAGGGNSSESKIPGHQMEIALGWGITGDLEGNIYFSDRVRHQVFLYRPSTGLVSAIVGINGQFGYSGDGGAPSSAELNEPLGLFYYDARKLLYIADMGNDVIRYVDLWVTNTIGTLSINSADPSMVTSFLNPVDVWIGTMNDKLFIADLGHSRIVQVDLGSNFMTVVAGNGTDLKGSRTSPELYARELTGSIVATSGAIHRPRCVCGDTYGNIYFGQISNQGFYRVNLVTGRLTRIAGNRDSVLRMTNTSATSVLLGGTVSSCKIGVNGDLFYLDDGQGSTTKGGIWKIFSASFATPADKRIEALQGYVRGVSLPSTSVSLGCIASIWGDDLGHSLYLADPCKSIIHRIQLSDQSISIYAGTGIHRKNKDQYNSTQSVSITPLNQPMGVVGSNKLNDKKLYFIDYASHAVCSIDQTIMMLSVVLNGSFAECGDVNAAYDGNSLLCYPLALALDGENHFLYVADSRYRVQRVDLTTSAVTVLIGNGTLGYRDGIVPSPLTLVGSPAVLVSHVNSMWFHSQNGESFLYLSDYENRVVRKVDLQSFNVSTVLGKDQGKESMFYYDRLQVANKASLAGIRGLCGDHASNQLYLLDDANRTLLALPSANASYYIQLIMESSPIQGNAESDDSGLKLASEASMGQGQACFVNHQGGLYLSDYIPQLSLARVRVVSDFTPSSQPSSEPSAQPTGQPTGHPSGQPTLQPSASPSQPNLASSRLLTTVAGYNTLSGPTDNNAITATFTNISGVCVNDLGHIYIADDVVVKKIFPESNSIILYAGGGLNMGAAVSPASDKKFGKIGGLAVDEQDRVYLTDSANSRVHVIDPTTMLVYTIAGAGSVGYSGDWSFANQSLLNRPSGLFYYRPSHILYVADTGNRVVRSVDLSARFNDVSAMGTSIINTVVGSYNSTSSTESTEGTSASFGEIRSIWVSAEGVIFLTDAVKCSVYKYDKTTELLDRVVGNGTCSSSVIPANSSVPATSISLQTIVSITGSDVEGTLYVSPNDANGLRRVNLSSLSMERVTASSDSLVVGHDLPAIIEKVSASYCFYCNNTMIIADNVQKYIWRYRPDTRNMEVITGFVGGLSVPANSVNLAAITGMAANTANGDLYFVDAGKNKVYLIKKQHSGTMISIMAGTGFAGYNGDDQPASLAALNNPMSIVIDARQGDLYISEFLNNRVRKIDGNTMIISTVMGTGISTCDSSLVTYRGPATSLNLCSPLGLAMDSRMGVLYYSDRSYVIRKLWLNNGTIETIAGNGIKGCLNGGLLASKIGNIYTMVLSRDGNSIYIFDVDYHCVRLVELVQDRITTVVGQCNTPGYSEDGVRASVAVLKSPRAGSLDAEGNLYIFTMNAGVHYVLRSYSERLYHFVGNSSVLGFSGDDLLPLSSLTSSSPASLIVDGDVYFSELYSQVGGITFGRVRRTYSIEPTSLPTEQPQCPSSFPSTRPSSQPFSSPSANPTSQPSTQPSGQPSAQPSSSPSSQPSSCPSTTPSSQPSTQPSGQPSAQPSSSPSSQPSSCPSTNPSSQPSTQPSGQPSAQPSSSPSSQPSSCPSTTPSSQPSTQPSGQPSVQPSSSPSSQPSSCPSTTPSSQPSTQPSGQPSAQPSSSPSSQPSSCPSTTPSSQPSTQPSGQPSVQPSSSPSSQPSSCPSTTPSSQPSTQPSGQPSAQPSSSPSSQPSSCPSTTPSSQPSTQPSGQPSAQPSSSPSSQPSSCSSTTPSSQPSTQPSGQPSVQPSSSPSSQPSSCPSTTPSSQPSTPQSIEPTWFSSPSLAPSTSCPITEPSLQPSVCPSLHPSTYQPSIQPSVSPVIQLSERPSVFSSLLSILSAVFSSDGLQVYVTFSAPTNMLELSSGMSFACDKVFVFSDANSYTCQWQNASQAIIRDTTRSTLWVGSTIQLVDATNGSALKISCSSAMSSSLCPNTVVDSEASVTIARPQAPILPSIGSFVTSRISNCSSWQLDLSVGSVVTGNTGRSWRSATFHVQGLTYSSNTSAITRELYAQFAVPSSLLVIANSYLTSGETYLVSVTLCNFLNACASKELTTTVSDSPNSLPPIVSITGGDVSRSIFVNESLLLTADAYLLQCLGKTSTSGLSYLWRIKLTSSASWLTVRSQSKDEKKFLLAAYSLSADMSYLAQVTVKDKASSLSTSVNVSIAVRSADLVAVISLPSPQQVRIGSSGLLLNASSSYDPNTVGKVPGTRLSFLWTCRSWSVGRLLVLPSCSLVVQSASMGGGSSLATSAVKISATNESSVGSLSVVSLTVYDASKPSRKNSTARMEVTVIASAAPLLSMFPSPSDIVSSLAYVNIDREVTLTSTVLSPVYRCNASWSVNDRSLDIEKMISSAYPKSVLANHLTYVNLHLSAFSLVGGSTYTFTLSCQTISDARSSGRRLASLDTSVNSSVSIQVSTNNPPTGGRLSVSPSSGYALNTSFLTSTDMWVDTDLPLSYTFSFLSSTSGGASNVYLPLKTKSAMNRITAILASANGVDMGTNVSVIAEDAYNASSGRVQAKVHILPVSSSSLTSLASSLLSQKNNMSVDELQNVISAVTTVVNVVDCSAAPNCTSLHRGSCQSTTNTCGACYSSYLSTGSDGDDNSVCLSQSALTGSSSGHSSCTSSSSCAGWQYCNASSLCSDSSKVCVSPTCSSHGTCLYLSSSTSQVVNSCSLISSSCEAVCKCVDGYGGADCSLTSAELSAQQALRSQLLDGLSTVVSKSDGDVSSLANAATSLSSIVRNQYDVSVSSSSQVANLAQQIINQAGQVGSGGSGGSIALNISTLLNPIDSAISAVVSSGSNSSAGALKNVSAVIFSFQDLLIKEKQSYSAVYDTFRLTTVVYDNAAETSITVPMALTQQEQIEKSLGGSSSIPSVTVTSKRNTTGGVYVSVVLLDQQAYGNKNASQQLNSDVITIRTKGVDYIDITLSPSSTATYSAIHYSIACPANLVMTKNFTCPDSGTVMFARCNGTAGTYNGTCPVLMQTCASLGLISGLGSSPSSSTGKQQCYATNSTRSSSTSSFLTCRCVIVNSAVDSTVAAGLVLQYVGSDISRTFRATSAAFSSASAFSKAYVVVALYSALWGCSLIAVLFFAWRWKKEHKKGSKQKKKLDEQQAASYASRLSAGGRVGVISGRVDGKRGDVAASKKETDKEIREKLSHYITTIFPAIFESKSVVESWQSEMYKHHFYVNFFFKVYLSRTPMLDVVKMLTLQSFMLFLLALLYDLNYPDDDGSCPTHKTASTCLDRKYMMDASRSYCEWTAGANGSYGCSYANPSFSLTTSMYIAMVISVATCLASEPLEEMMGTLAAPSSSEEIKKEVNDGVGDSPRNVNEESVIEPKDEKRMVEVNGGVSVAPASAEVRGGEPVRPSLASSRKPSFHATCPVRHLPDNAVAAQDAAYVHAKQLVMEMHPLLERRESYRLELMRRASTGVARDANQMMTLQMRTNPLVEEGDSAVLASFNKLRNELFFQRSLLQPSEREEFDRAWCLDGNRDDFVEIRNRHWLWGSKVIHVESLIKAELASVSKETEEVLSVLDIAPDGHKGFEILQLFIQDLLGRNTPAARIFAVKSEQDFEPVSISSWQLKAVIAVIIFGMNIFFVYYTILKGYTKGVPWQQDYVKAWVAQVLLDIFLFETILCTWLHLLIPHLISREVNKVYILLQECVNRLNDSQYYRDPSIFLNATDYFFVSRKVARNYPHLVESALVLSYANHLPGEMGKVWQSKVGKEDRPSRGGVEVVVAGGGGNRSESHSSYLFFLGGLLKGGMISIMLYLGAYAPLPLQRLVIRVMEPLILSALTLGFYFFMHKPIYLGVLMGGVVLLSCLLLWDYYRTKRNKSRNGGGIIGLAGGVAGRSASAKSFQSVAPAMISTTRTKEGEGQGQMMILFSNDQEMVLGPPEDEEGSPEQLHRASRKSNVMRKEAATRGESEDSVRSDFSSENSLPIPFLAKQSTLSVKPRSMSNEGKGDDGESEKNSTSTSSRDFDYDSDEDSFSHLLPQPFPVSVSTISVLTSNATPHAATMFVKEQSSSSDSDDKLSFLFSDDESSRSSGLPSPLLSPVLSRLTSRSNSYTQPPSNDHTA